ncbi:MAG: hypothetical protein J6N51_10805 [Selenomonas sp.]|nr:hypothetical protein [Selenomonas sp.]MBP3730996.1 hypothetical protein [Mailhella sp.]
METQESKLTREQEIAAVINTRYSIDDQIAILRQKDTKPEAYEEFFAFCEEVKSKIPKE